MISTPSIEIPKARVGVGVSRPGRRRTYRKATSSVATLPKATQVVILGAADATTAQNANGGRAAAVTAAPDSCGLCGFSTPVVSALAAAA